MIPLATGFGPTLEMTPAPFIGSQGDGRGQKLDQKKIRAPHRADSVYYPITCVLVLFCK